jgi:transposase
VKKHLPETVSLSNVEVWFQDEARVGQQGTLTRVWAKKGTRPRLPRQRQYEYAYIFGAVCAERDIALGLIMPQVNTASMQLHLQQISAVVPKGKHAVIVLDRAGWHMTDKLGKFHNMTLLPLPPTSPELNPQEQVWQQLRNRYLANRTYENYEDIVDTYAAAWNHFISEKNTIRNLCQRDWAKL